MQIKVDNDTVYEVDDFKKKVICNDIMEDAFDEDIRRRVRYIIEHKFERCLDRLKDEWIPKLKGRVTHIPTDDAQLALLIFAQEDYKDRKLREEDEKRKREGDPSL
jgi:hypothetical protein